MPPRGPPSAKEFERVSRRTTNVIKDHVTSNLLVCGSAAAYLWADIGRVPHVRARLLNPHINTFDLPRMASTS